MTRPTIHPNGTSGHMLATAYELAYDAVQAAYDKPKATDPNPRDFEPFDFKSAVEEHHERQQHLAAVMNDLEELIGHCEKQGGKS